MDGRGKEEKHKDGENEFVRQVCTIGSAPAYTVERCQF